MPGISHLQTLATVHRYVMLMMREWGQSQCLISVFVNNCHYVDNAETPLQVTLDCIREDGNIKLYRFLGQPTSEYEERLVSTVCQHYFISQKYMSPYITWWVLHRILRKLFVKHITYLLHCSTISWRSIQFNRFVKDFL